MKANELMIGDWVFLKNGKVLQTCKVTVIGNATQNRNKIGKYVCLDTSDEFPTCIFEIDKISPIPLTVEILEKNGMHLYNRKTNSLMERCNHSDCFKEDENFIVELSLDNDGKIRWTINGDEYTIMSLDYVHQLQHALKLCGINKEITL